MHAEMKSESRGARAQDVEVVTLGLSLRSATIQLCCLEQVTDPPVPNLLLCKMQHVVVPTHWVVAEDRMK